VDEVGDGTGYEGDRISCGGAKTSQRRNTTVHGCWHRNTSIGYSDELRAFQVINGSLYIILSLLHYVFLIVINTL
jgi:hypothetical protein